MISQELHPLEAPKSSGSPLSDDGSYSRYQHIHSSSLSSTLDKSSQETTIFLTPPMNPQDLPQTMEPSPQKFEQKFFDSSFMTPGSPKPLLDNLFISTGPEFLAINLMPEHQYWGQITPPIQSLSSPLLRSASPHLSCALNQKCKCVCGQSFLDITLLFDHSANDCIAKCFVCSDCNRGFTRRQDLKRHRTIHGEQPSKCTSCDARFRKNAVKKHVCKNRKMSTQLSSQHQQQKELFDLRNQLQVQL